MKIALHQPFNDARKHAPPVSENMADKFNIRPVLVRLMPVHANEVTI